jgi:flagellum-specific peptidoglycan hydrolase FlgJ
VITLKFATRQAYINFVAPIAVACRVEGSPIFPSVRIAQTIQEQGGYSIPDHWNLVGYKVGTQKIKTAYWDGSFIHAGTWEEEGGQRVSQGADFRRYSSLFNCFRDQDLLFYRLIDIYKPLIQASNPFSQAVAFGPKSMRGCGYATDSAYGKGVSNIIKFYKLEVYDQQAEEEIQLMQDRLTKLEQVVQNQAQQIQTLKSLGNYEDTTGFSKEAFDYFTTQPSKDNPIVSDRTGDYSFFRMITIVYRILKWKKMI